MNAPTLDTAMDNRVATAAIPIVALDYPSADAAMKLVDELDGADFFKVGLQLFTAEGPRFVKTLLNRGKRIFLDLKLHDIPNTVAGAVRSASDMGVHLLTIHAGGGPSMLEAAAGAAAASNTPPELLAVTILTSIDSGELGHIWGRNEIDMDLEVSRLARMAEEAGIDGVVSSVHEAASVKASFPSLRILTPGIRLTADTADDQARVSTPAQAARVGVDYMVIGRTVTAADDPSSAYEEVLLSIGQGLDG